ncbi:hypothetical protein J3458_002355 [Metarhizium acridum]|uniref:uncharacterized protein n=1 Tax=Metarhizium acridum TaxID=92637 RepID=UPI001C6CFBD1|nr:hypothetical protein J3458_002355 [Metarhizium acridum]
MPQAAMALETASSLWGLTVNPFNSSFGDGVLIAMRGAATAPMTDIDGSNSLSSRLQRAVRHPSYGRLHAQDRHIQLKPAPNVDPGVVRPWDPFHA